MNQEIKAQWVAALRSGEYTQGKEALRNDEGGFCCLGVLCELAIAAGVCAPAVYNNGYNLWEYEGASSTLPYSVMRWADLSSDNPPVQDSCLAELNDGEWDTDTGAVDNGMDFNEIADIIEEHL
jgi:hypothetical protein